jgi:hypothetical protein
MLKRNIAILIGSAVLAGYANLAVAQEGTFPQGSVGSAGTVTLSPAQAKYFEEQAARNPNPKGASGRPYPINWGLGQRVYTPAALKYFADREAKIQAERGPWVSVFDDCKMHSHGDAGFHS